MVNKIFKSRIAFFALSIVMMLTLLFPASLVSADTEIEHYATWKDYQAAGHEDGAWVDVADAMDAVFEAGKEYFKAGDLEAAYDAMNHGYYGYYETTGFERVVMGYVSGARKTEVELQFAACKAAAKNKESYEIFEAEVDVLKGMIREDAHILDGTENNSGGSSLSAGMAAFIASFGIMLREGFEAILIVGAIIAYLKKSTENQELRKRKLRPVYIGSIFGVVMSFAMAAILEAIKLANTASQEIIEGVTALLAVVVLYYVSVWMMGKSEEDAWQGYIEQKVQASNQKASIFALAFTAFLAVFREGAEVVLFYQPMLKGDNVNMVWAGFAVGSVVLVFVYLAVKFLSVKIPLKPFFVGTSILMCIMAVSFLGAGIKELIEGDVIVMTSPTWLQWIPPTAVLDVLGIYPIIETLIPQLILVIISIVLFARIIKKNNAIHAEAEIKRAEVGKADEK